MTFTFDSLSGLVFFLCYIAVLCMCFSGMQQYDEKCSLHPGTSECIHRQKRK